MTNQDELQALMMENLKTYIHDNFLSTEQITQAVTQTGVINTGLQQLLLNTGVQEASEVRANYARSWLNPLYSKLYLKLRLNDMDGVTLWFGLKSTLAAPSWGMTESCAGVLIDYKNDAGTPYFYTGNGDPDNPGYQATPIKDIDMARWLLYKIEGYKFSWYSLPYTVPYFDKNVLPGLKQGIIRKWSGVYTNGSTIPDDTLHYLVFYIKNGVGLSRTMEVQKINYAEVYPD